MGKTHRPRRLELRTIPASRRVVVQALRAGRRISPIHGLVSLDVTEARQRIADLPDRPSFTAFMVASVGRAAAAHPEVHAYRNWRGQLVLHRFVDVAVLVETQTTGGSFPLAHLIKDADLGDVSEISREIRKVKADPASSRSGQLLARTGAIGGRIPGVWAMAYRLMSRSTRLRQMTGTVSVTSVGMFAGGGGFGIGFPTVATLSVLVGGLSERPRIVDGQVAAREILDLTVTVDHNVVDGAPAARFVADLRNLVETAAVLQ